jgi:hypothetical protein
VATVSIAANPARCSGRCRYKSLYRSVLPASLVFLVTFAVLSSAQASRPTEAQVQAAYLFNFGKFVTWPEPRDSGSFQICILGKDPFGHLLDATVNGETIKDKKITIQRISSMQQAPPCSILFISSSEENKLAGILITAQRLNLLTVSTMKRFAERGGMIGLIAQQDRVRFEVNLRAAEQAHLLLSSELLKVAVNVLENKVPGT